jgi:orotate phosphoribosyltransferase
LLEIKAVQLRPHEPFTWASGLLSPIYCDNRVALSHPSVRSFLVECLVEASQGLGDFDTVAGVATAGIAHGALLADRLEKPFVYVRSSAKEHGRRNLVEGELPAQSRVLVVEDLISTGGSSLRVVEALQDAGAEVTAVLAIFQYGLQPATNAFAVKNIPLHTLTDYDTLMREAVELHYINPEDLDVLRRWRENPEGWGALYA